MASVLFSPLQLRGIILKNRIAVSSMCQYSSEDGFANDWHFVHLGSRAVGGAGLVMTEATAVTPEGRISPQDLGLWKDEHVPMLERIVRFVHEHGAVAGVQLAHAGRKASTAQPWKGGKRVGPEAGGWTPLAPSALPYEPEDPPPHALSEEEIAGITRAFADATVRAEAAGFEWIELHAAHGYLLHEFLSPLSNQRTDRYGGTFENRVRLVLEVLRAIRSRWPEGAPLALRISATDWLEGGWTVEDSVALAKLVMREGVDLIDCSSGALAKGAKIPAGPGYQTLFSDRIRREVGIPTGAVGMIREPFQAEHIVRTGQADLVFLARELLRHPFWPRHAARELHVPPEWPAQYERAND